MMVVVILFLWEIKILSVPEKDNLHTLVILMVEGLLPRFGKLV